MQILARRMHSLYKDLQGIAISLARLCILYQLGLYLSKFLIVPHFILCLRYSICDCGRLEHDLMACDVVYVTEPK